MAQGPSKYWHGAYESRKWNAAPDTRLQPTCGDELECLERFGDIGVCLSDTDYLCLKDDQISFLSDAKCTKADRSCVELSMTRHQVKDLRPKPTEDGPEKHDERKHVDLESVDVKTHRRFCERNQMSVTVSNNGAGAPCATGRKTEADTNATHDDVKPHHADLSPPSIPFCSNAKSEHFHEQRDVSKAESSARLQPHVDLRISDNYFEETSEQDDYEVDDGISLVLSDDCIPCATEDESHYITTHEIQLSELSDHEEDYELGVGSSTSWDVEEDNRVYSFVDYASFEAGGAAGEGGHGRQPCSQGAAAATVSTLLESDLREAARLTSSDESVSKPEQQHCSGNSGGQIRLSIRTTSRAINDPSNIQEQEKILYRARRAGDVSRYVLTGVDGKAETLRGKEVPEYSSGTSSAVSELDDADKEVRTLTARAFKSLAYPYFDAIHFSTSSESSASEHALGINRWSAFVDLKYGNMNMDHHQSSKASFQIAKSIDNRGYKGIVKAPTAEILPPHGASSSTKKIELMGKFGQGHSGVIRLTETLNFRCNVKSGIPAGESRTNFAGSRSTDEVTNASQSRGASKPPSKIMEDTHKKAVFASSLIKNVISKKMQFEQERKMERGELSEPQQTPSPSCPHQESDDVRGKRNVKLSESGSDYTIMCVNELGDIVDTKSDSREQQSGIDTKKGALDSSRSTLHRSQNSAFRCWKDDELGFQKDLRNDQTAEETLAADGAHGEASPYSAGSGKLKKMAHLFVPNIQKLPKEGEATQQLSGNYSTCGRGRGTKDSKSPEIQINLRRIEDNKSEPCAVSKLRAPNLGCNLIRADHAKPQALAALKGEFSEKVPHFTVRDIRDNKGKLQTPIYQVRDVRKLVKSSYHFVSLDNTDNKSHSASAEQSKHVPSQSCNTVSPIVIKCQSVNTSSNGKQCENLQVTKREPLDMDRSSPEGVKNAPTQRATGSASLGTSHNAESSSESRISTKRHEKVSDIIDKKPESKVPNQAALEKLQAAVKTMEQLYVYEKNEWKRKNEPRPLTGSHVLSLIASEERPGHEEETAWRSRRNSHSNTAKAPPGRAGDSLLKQEESPTCVGCDDRSKSVQNPSSTGSSVKVSETSKTPQPNTATRAKNLVSKSPKLPTSVKTCERRSAGNEDAEVKGAETFAQEYSADNENYLTIPVKSQPSRSKQPLSADKAFTPQSHPCTPPGHAGHGLRGHEEYKHAPEIPSAAIYHSLPLGMSATQPQVYCFSPAITPAPSLDPFQATQRKMLLDPSTGNYYLVDTPVQPATKRLFDPETGQYVDVPMPQPPMTPVPMSISPLALSSGLYGHTYMIYPGLVPTPSVIPARALLQSQMSVQAEVDDKSSSLQTEGMHIESPFYMSTGKSSQVASGVQQQAAANRPQQGLCSIKQPVISITSQQGPRIIAPPSFDGTTMSFMVEHR